MAGLLLFVLGFLSFSPVFAQTPSPSETMGSSRMLELEAELLNQLRRYIRRQPGESYLDYQNRAESHPLHFSRETTTGAYLEGLKGFREALRTLNGNVIDFSQISFIRVGSVGAAMRVSDQLFLPSQWTESHLTTLQEVDPNSVSPPKSTPPPSQADTSGPAYAMNRVLARPKAGFENFAEPDVLGRRLLTQRGDWIFFHSPLIDPRTFSERLKKTGRYEYVEPDYKLKLASNYKPNDPLAGEQHGLFYPFGLNAFTVWKTLEPSLTEVIVAVIDSGVNLNHPDLVNTLLPGQDYSGAGTVQDAHGHGTHVTGIIAAEGNNDIGIVGTTHLANVRVLPLRISYELFAFISDAVKAIDFAVASGVRIINLSLGSEEYSQALRDAIEAAGESQVLAVAAAGNEAKDSDVSPFYPAAFNLPNIISVGAIGYVGYPTSFSNWGECTVDLYAPGSGIISTYLAETPETEYEHLSGTSMSAPHVSGIAAQIWSRFPQLTLEEMVYILRKGTLYSSNYEGFNLTAGRAEFGSALQAAEDLLAGAPIETIGPEDCPNGEFSEPPPPPSQGGGGCGQLDTTGGDGPGSPLGFAIWMTLLALAWPIFRLKPRT